MTFESLLIFFATTLVIVVTPGAAAIAAASQGASNGASRALAGVAGIASNVAFSIIKWAGIAYLV